MPTLLHRSSDISFSPFSLILSCSWEVLQNLGSDHLPILLIVLFSLVFCPNKRAPAFNFQKACWDFAFYFDSHCPSAMEYSSLSFLCCCSLLWHWMRPNFPFLSAASNINLNPGGPLKWMKRLMKDIKAFAAAHRSDEDCQACISAFRFASLLSPRLRDARQLALLSHLNLTLNLFTLLRSVTGFYLIFLLPYVSNCSSPRDLASVYVDYLRSHFSVSQPKALHSRTWGYLSKLCRATCPEESHSAFCSPFYPAEFLAAATNLFFFTATGSHKVAYLILQVFPSSGMDFLHTFLIFSNLCIPFLLCGRHLLLFSSIRWESLSTLLLLFGLSLSPPASQSFLNASFYRVYFCFWSLISFSLSASSVFRPGRSTSDQILILSQSISDGFNKPRPGS